MISLCPYKNLLGKPNTGLHKYRLFNIAVFDVAVVVFVCYIIAFYTKYNFWITLVIVFLSGIIIHRIFCVRTGVDKILFPNK
jgi:fatty acid desaturase